MWKGRYVRLLWNDRWYLQFCITVFELGSCHQRNVSLKYIPWSKKQTKRSCRSNMHSPQRPFSKLMWWHIICFQLGVRSFFNKIFLLLTREESDRVFCSRSSLQILSGVKVWTLRWPTHAWKWCHAHWTSVSQLEPQESWHCRLGASRGRNKLFSYGEIWSFSIYESPYDLLF